MEKINRTVKNISALDQAAMQEASTRLNNLTKPVGSLGKLEELAIKVSAITGNTRYAIKNKLIATMAADHGVSEEGVSLFPKEVTAQMVYNFISGGAAINVLGRHYGVRVIVVDMGVASTLDIKDKNFIDKKTAFGTKNITKGPAMSAGEAIMAVNSGIDIFEQELKNGIDIVGTGDMGIANTTASCAIICAVSKFSVEQIAGRGTGIDDMMLERKIDAIKKSLAVNKPDAKDPIDLLSKVGGFEIAGLTGWILAACSHKVPVVIDGFISTAAAYAASLFNPHVKDYYIASHASAEKGHRLALEYLGLKPIFDLDMRLGEGTASCLGISIIEASMKILNEMATFEKAGVSREDK